MLARLQQCITLGLLAASLAWAWFFWAAHPVWAVVGSLGIVCSYAPLLALEFVLLRCVHGADPVRRASVVSLAKAWWGEVLTTPRVFFWRQPFRANAVPDALETSGQRGVVFIHGFFCNRGFWTPWLRPLRHQGRAFVAVDLEPVWGSIGRYADTVERAVRQVTAATGLPPVLICHSMGGLAARAWLRSTPGAAERVHRVITIGSPHAGTWMARFGHGLNGREMRLQSPWLAELAKLADEAQAAREGIGALSSGAAHAKFVCWYSNADNIVFPASTATLPGADNRFIPATAHVALAFHPRVVRESLALV